MYTVKSLGREENLKRKKSQEPVSSDKNLSKSGGKESSMSQSLDLTMGTMRPIEEKPSASKTKSSLPYIFTNIYSTYSTV